MAFWFSHAHCLITSDPVDQKISGTQHLLIPKLTQETKESYKPFLTKLNMKVVVKDNPKRIDADLMIPGRGDPLEHASLIYSGSSIIYAGSTDRLPAKFVSLPAFKVPVLMPGLWDCHVHFMGSQKYAIDDMITTDRATAGARSVRDVIATLNAGFTSVREMAGHGIQLAEVINEGWIPGPNIYSSISILSQTAGHGDARSVSLPHLRELTEHGAPCYLCDGPDECIKAVRAQIRRGASVIKVAASGGIASTGDDISARQFSDEELETIVGEATRNRMIVAAHCHSNASIDAAIRCGIRTIEHGSFLDETLVKKMVEKDVMLVATSTMIELSASYPDPWTPEQHAQLLEVQKHHRKSYRLAVKTGVRCALGSDLGSSSQGIVPWVHGRNGAEFKYAVDAGMTPLQAIEAGTANGPATLGPKAPKSGQLCEGYDADFIGLAANPLEDISVLADTDKILHVWKGGNMYKKDGRNIDVLNTGQNGAVSQVSPVD